MTIHRLWERAAVAGWGQVLHLGSACPVVVVEGLERMRGTVLQGRETSSRANSGESYGPELT